MKKKLGILLSAGALVFGMAAFGLVGAKVAEPAKATMGDYTSDIQLVGAGLDVGWTNTANTDYQFVEQSDGSFSWTGTFKVERFRAIVPESWTKALDWDNVVSTSGKVADGTFVKASTIGTDGDNNIWCTVAGTYKLLLDSGKTKLSIIKSDAATYDVSEYAVLDGVKETSAMATENATEGVYFTPTDLNKPGYLFNGWYTDDTCTTAYEAKAWTAAGSLFAKYTTVTARTIYFKTAGWSNTNVYTFGGDSEFGAWPGTQVATSSITNGIAYQGKYGIVKVTLSKNDTKVVFNDGTGGAKGTAQTNDLKIVNGAYYWVDAADGSTGDADKGSAAAVVFDINEARRSVTASGSILEGSVCGISKAKAKTLVEEYDALNTTAKGYADEATDYTYDYTDPANKMAFPSIADIVVQLRKIASAGSGAAVVDNKESNLTPVIIMVVSLGIAAIASAGLWLSRRKER